MPAELGTRVEQGAWIHPPSAAYNEKGVCDTTTTA